MNKTEEKLFDEIVSQTLYILRLSAKRRAETVRRLNRMAVQVKARLLAEDELNRYSRKNLNTFLSQSKKVITTAYNGIQLELEFGPTSKVIGERMATAIEVILGVEVARPSDVYLRSVASDVLINGGPLEEHWTKAGANTADKFAKAVRTGLSNSETNQQIVRRVLGTPTTPGVMKAARHEAAALVQTSVQAVANDARRQVFDANGDVIKGFRQVSTLDGRTSSVCIAYSGAEWNLDRKPMKKGGLPWNGGCPRHFNCRSLEIPILRSFAEMGVDLPELPGPKQRASVDGPLDGNTSFESFLSRKDKAFQDELLGVGRADMWRKGVITLKDLVDNYGNPMSLAQLKEKFARPVA